MSNSENLNETSTAESTVGRVEELLAANAALEIQLKDQLLSAERRRKELTTLYEELDATRKERDRLKRLYSDIQSSLSFRVGRLITCIPRKIRDMFSGH